MRHRARVSRGKVGARESRAWREESLAEVRGEREGGRRGSCPPLPVPSLRTGVAYVLREGVVDGVDVDIRTTAAILAPAPNVHAELDGSRSFEHGAPAVMVGHRIRRNICVEVNVK